MWTNTINNLPPNQAPTTKTELELKEGTNRKETAVMGLYKKARELYFQTCVTRNLVIRSGSLLFSLDRIISSMSPCSFSMTTNTRSGVSNIHSRFTIPG